TNLEEQTLGTNPQNADSDGDGLNDGAEVKQYHTDPNKRDTDGDSLSDGLEVNTYKTDPTKLDSDGDGISDTQEVSLGSDPADKNDKPLRTSIGVVTGADPGEGLDLDGDFPYALALGAGDGGAVTIRSANFQPLLENEVAGATLLAGNTAANWYVVNYGDSADDQALAAATSSIRWSAAGSAQPDVVLTLENLEVGAEYKLQLLFGEQCCNRGFDVFVDQALAVKDFNPGNVHGGIANGKQEALITHTHFARSSTLVIRLDGANASSTFSDHNAIFNAVTVEKVAAKTDTDGDGLPDAWERLYFGGLTETATGDKDGDGLTNLDEYNLATNPTKADSDRDGLADGAEKTAGTNPANPDTDTDGLRDGEEVNVYHSDPLKGDGDNDGLPDAAEIVTYKTDPSKADTDGDGQNDGAEAIAGTDPLKAQPATKIEKITIASFTGGDPEDGLDLQGTFVYATSFGTDEAAGKAGDAVFTKDDAAGIRWTTQNVIKTWFAAEFGDSANDDTLERAIAAIRWSAAPNRPKIELAVIPGSTYKLQLLFAEQCCAGRGFDILVDGNTVAENFIPAEIQGGANNTSMGAVLSAEVTTERDSLVIVLDGPGADLETVTDHNATINGLTLEALKLGAVVTATRITQAKVEATGVSLTFESVAGRRYAIEYRETLGTSAATTITAGIAAGAASTTYTDADGSRRAKGQGYYRVRSL
ncbi:MAG: hypothetical protein K1X57_23175, partial [Gemmataceae bacterium]|nr:hypothetical protein [Gemmataceae bacterium]